MVVKNIEWRGLPEAVFKNMESLIVF